MEGSKQELKDFASFIVTVKSQHYYGSTFSETLSVNFEIVLEFLENLFQLLPFRILFYAWKG